MIVEQEKWRVKATGVGEIKLAVKYRSGGDDLLVLMHGLGCAKESFDEAFEIPALDHYSLLTFDFPEHGRSDSLSNYADIGSVAEVVKSLIDLLPRQRVHLVCHSMGGAIGLVAAQDIHDLGCFVSIEGNLVAGDCGLVSRGIAEQSAEEFDRRGFRNFVDLLKASAEPSLIKWARWYGLCSPRGLHSMASSLVQWCDKDALADIFLSLKTAAYVHGSNSDVTHLEKRLVDIPTHVIDRSGHFPMVDNPVDLYSLIGDILDDRLVTRAATVSAVQSI